ncbi:MAG: hypothetical protein V1755_05300 [Chloroflexota bacterium]
MMPEESTTTPFTNRSAVLSFAAGILALVAVCAAIVPVPFSGYVCFPAAAVLGVAAIVGGLKSLHQIRSSGEKGFRLAVVGLGIGGAALLATLCIVVLAITLWSRLPEALRLLAQ